MPGHTLPQCPGRPRAASPYPSVQELSTRSHTDLTSLWFLGSPWFSSHCFPRVLEASIWPQHKFPNSVSASTSNLNRLIPLKFPLPEGPSFLHLHSLLSSSPQDTSSREPTRLPHCWRYHLNLVQHLMLGIIFLQLRKGRQAVPNSSSCSCSLPWTLVPPELLCTSATF